MRKRLPVQDKKLICILLWVLPVLTYAESLPPSTLGNCGSSQPLSIDWPVGLTADTTHIGADEVVAVDSDYYTFNGQVKLFRNNLSLFSNKIIYKESDDTVKAYGDVLLVRDEARFFSKQLFYNIGDEKGHLDDVRYIFPLKHAHGTAKRLDILGKDENQLYNTTYTTCEDEKPAWQLHARRLNLNNQTNIGTAKNVWIEFMRVPVFYFPYLSFPLSGRKTGFLIPTFGSSSQVGTKLSVPYYLNIAPDLDATLTIDNFTDRGARLSGELRFLNQYDNGQINAEYLPGDDRTHEDRQYISFTHDSHFLPRLTTKVELRRASDKEYFDDFGDQLSTTNIVHLESKAVATYMGDNWSVASRIVKYQTLDEAIPDSSRPYKILPEINFKAKAPKAYYSLLPEFKAEYVRFDRKDRVAGGRLDIQPSISMPIEGAPGFLTPKINLRHTQYALTDQAAGTDDSPTRTLPVYSIDSGLFFERDFSIGKQNLIQTLEPRLFFLSVPFEDQSNLIVDQSNISRVFDTALASQSFSQLFAENRFTGVDRIGDTKQISYALTSRFLDSKSGVEKLSASIGRTRYLKDRRVGLPGALVETDNRSDVFVELLVKPTANLNINSKAQWDRALDKLKSSNIQIRYNEAGSKLLNVGYLISRNNLGVIDKQESDISLFWPINHNWSLIARRNFNLLKNRNEELLGGLEYNSCCWAFRIVTRRYIIDDLTLSGVDQYENGRSVMFQLELKGLTAIGKDVKSLLQNTEYGVSGY